MHVSRRSILAAAAAAAALPVPLLTACGAKGAGAVSAPPVTSANPKVLLVGFAISAGFDVMDMAGPWETFADATKGDEELFKVTTVGPSRDVIEGGGGLRVQPSFTYADAPQLDIVVVGAQKGGPALHEFLRAQARTARLVMSVCTGAFQLARAGLLEGKSATTHHDFYEKFAAEFPKVKLVRQVRFVDQGAVCSAGGLTSGVNLALHVIERTFGEDVSKATARYMEFVSGERPA